MSIPKITFVQGDDWIAMYADGIKVAEGHSLHPRHVLDALGIPYADQDAPRVEPDRGEIIFDDRLDQVRAVLYREEE